MTKSAAWSWPNSTIPNFVDGDTVDAIVTRDLGFGGTASFPIRLRLNRINAPKLASAPGERSRLFLIDLIQTAQVQIDTYRTYKYGGGTTSEWMAEITLPDGHNVSDVMVAEGQAVYWDGQGPRPADS